MNTDKYGGTTRRIRHIRYFLLPGYGLLVLWLLFTVCLVGWIVLASLSSTKDILSNNLLSSGIHFENYQNVIARQNIAKYFLNSLFYSIIVCSLDIIIAAPAAYVLSRYQFPFKKPLTTMFTSAMGIPTIMIILPIYGLLNRIQYSGNVVTLLFLYVATTIPFTIVFLLGFFSTLPKALEDAALVDGCTVKSAFWRIFLPIAQPGIITITIFNFINIWNEYFMALIFVNDADHRPLSLGLQAIIQSMRYSGDWAGLYAAVVIVFLPTFILYLLMSRRIIVGLTGGAIKE